MNNGENVKKHSVAGVFSAPFFHTEVKEKGGTSQSKYHQKVRHIGNKPAHEKQFLREHQTEPVNGEPGIQKFLL